MAKDRKGTCRKRQDIQGERKLWSVKNPSEEPAAIQ
jgi:hypothetical protein